MKSENLMPIERTLYPPIRDILINLGFKAIQEIRISEKEQYIDILFNYEGDNYIIEVKIGNEYLDLIKGLLQIYGYSQENKINNKIVILFPEHVRDSARTIEEFEKRIRNISCKSLFLTGNWWDLRELSIDESFNMLKSKIDKKLSASKTIEVISKLLEETVKSLAKLINIHYKDYASLDKTLNYLTKDQGLFLKLSSGEKDQQKLSKKQKGQIINLLAYILVNQILFYFLYSKKTGKVPPLEKIGSFKELKTYFEKIKFINFRPIFDIDVVSRIPKTREILDEVNIIINSLNPLEVEDTLKHDLYGRLIGKSMPEETRKTLASYYTKVASSEILTQLSIEKWNETIWDTACGSGTILVSAYNKKSDLYLQDRGMRITSGDKNKIHKEFLEKQITGTDIMPFACHLTGLNLSAQNLDIDTNFMRISNHNSLRFTDLSKPILVREAYDEISSALETIEDPQRYLDEYPLKEKEKLGDGKQKSKKFLLEKPDIVLINPPFTTLNKLPRKYRKAFSKEKITKICGKEINLWGYFLAHSDLILRNGGKLGAIIPTTFLRGKRTENIRTYILKHYSIDYIIKPPTNLCFSEDTKFSDIILIARKTPYERAHECNLLFIHENIDKRHPEDIKFLIKDIKTELEQEKDSEKYSFRKIQQDILYENRNNLMPFFFSNRVSIQKTINSFVERISHNRYVNKMEQKLMEDGHQLRGENRPKRSVITRNLGSSRITRPIYYFDSDTDPAVLKYFDREKNVERQIQKSKLVKTFRTIIEIDTYDISEKFDYVFREKLKRKKEKDSSHLLIPNRFPLPSDAIYSMASYSKEKITPLNSFIMYKCPEKESKILCLYLQSIFSLAQIIRIAKRAMGEGGFADYFEMKQDDLKEIYVPNLKKIGEESYAKLLNYFDSIKKNRLQSLIKQLKEKSDDRIKLDLLINEELDLGFSKKEILEVYENIVEELTQKTPESD